MSQWYAIRTATRREMDARWALSEAGVTAFFPREARWGVRHGQIGRVRVEEPLIRGYLFVLIEPEDAERVLAVEYVHSFLGYLDERGDNQPLRIPLHFITALQADERAGRYDRTLHVKAKYRPKKGDRVKVVAGPWVDWFGKLLATPRGDRAHVMMEGPFGRGVTIPATHLSPAA